MKPTELTFHLLINVKYRFKKNPGYQPCHCMKSIEKPKKRRLKGDQDSISDHHLVSIVAPSFELFNNIHEACSVLENFGIPYETTIVAAHRSPTRAINTQLISKLER
jgi:hypothetical protein